MIFGVLQQDVCLRHYFTKNTKTETEKNTTKFKNAG
jgi:hypothetical protein